ncbi:PREDICTED: ras GTPase-activating protein-binding protein 2 [Tarenaya hassleriana]|uniref:ras GTPase-activating protein-binding protein 2 n=1 Tax=Tarenaya hassleriana TaxID=28532 RepID=UPI00053C4AD6|nr:PREDICTED: ras GTPase-activating protein-binding protein 2 [Tarenaya hassleriana]XP_019056654.1 PREDICTED: ras GTPase-activating protein-binding protein 2 [Tarenaya hassleriana]
MAKQEASPAPSAEVVGHAFVEQYYHILHQSPGLVHRFYQDSSFLTRPDASGSMSIVTTMQAINEKILSLNYEEYKVEIETADAQESYDKGAIVLVTGCLTGKDSVRKKFTQMFFLAPQDKGYFVLNDVFRFFEEKDPAQAHSITTNGVSENTEAVEPEHVTESHESEPVASIEEEDLDNVAEVYDPSDRDEGSVVEDEIVEPLIEPRQTEILSSGEAAPVSQEDAPKQSYASILKLMKSGPTTSHVVAANKPKAAPVSDNQKQTAPPAKPVASSEAFPSNENTPDSRHVNGEDDGHSIYVRNLPFYATPTQLEEAFKKFGPIKHEGIQVRSNKQGFCFGFVEFETSSGKQAALEASPITIGDCQAVIEEKNTNTRVSSSSTGRGRYSSGRGSFRADSFKGGRGRGGYGRGEFRSQGEFSGRPKGSNQRNGVEGYQRVHQNGGGRGGGRGGGGGSS